jgi:hypothetical protein
MLVQTTGQFQFQSLKLKGGGRLIRVQGCSQSLIAA